MTSEKPTTEGPISSPGFSEERPRLRDKTSKPEGTIPKEAQTYVIAGIAIVIILAVLFSNNRARPAGKSGQKEPLMMITDGNAKNISDFGADMTEKQRAAENARLEKEMNAEAQAVNSVPASSPAQTQTGPGAANGTSNGAQSPPPPDPLVEHERELAYNSRFASNFAFSTSKTSGDSKAATPVSALGTATAEPPRQFETGVQPTDFRDKRPLNINVNSAQGQPYVVFEGTALETALVNRLDGDFSGPVKVLVTNPVYSHDRQHVLIPEGTFVLGETNKVAGFGQRRLAVVFHRMIMPDGFSVDLDQFKGLNQIGESGLKDKVNNHYLEIFGSSIALGVIAGATETSNANAGLYESGSEAYRSGVASSLSQSATQVLDRFLNIPPTITIREGHRIRVYFTQDLLLPGYENHTVPPNI